MEAIKEDGNVIIILWAKKSANYFSTVSIGCCPPFPVLACLGHLEQSMFLFNVSFIKLFSRVRRGSDSASASQARVRISARHPRGGLLPS